MVDKVTFQKENSLRNKSTAYMLLLFAGVVGAHRYYLGRRVSAVIMTLLGIAAVYAVLNELLGWQILLAAIFLWCLLDVPYIYHVIRQRRREVYDLKPRITIY
ncbi:NINE protein [Marinobacterium mangrovicola]|uniref:TM2 domain-containing protein n=1 Tax=Marinobacterium mangrovicola TaxID=1476959 RepID=A0A4R1G5M9_9GAMM|nr:TM2 domain-containing protein [Marinobacterium mangrovicola]TCK02954.1 TM2 domain-containing protein [Marinobacterium mangrovicola]